KPVIFSTNVGSGGAGELPARLTAEGQPVLSGLASTLRVIGKAMAYRDWLTQEIGRPAPVPSLLRQKWASRLSAGTPLTEAESLTLLSDYGVPTIPFVEVDRLEAAQAAAIRLGWPVALKTAMPGILHKSDAGGVYLNLGNMAELNRAYADLAG